MNTVIGLFVSLLLSQVTQENLPTSDSSVQQSKAELSLLEPLDYQVFQRKSLEQGVILVHGELNDRRFDAAAFEVLISSEKDAGQWQQMKVTKSGKQFSASLPTAAGGWFRFALRATVSGEMIAQQVVDHVGVGEVFVVAGQSNSANHGEVKQEPRTGRVVACDGHLWKLANDPQPGASGNRGSFIPPLGDRLVERFDVPVGFIACGIGATSVREWLPKGTTFPNPPTIEARVERLADGNWASKGQAYAMFVERMKPLGMHGFRAVLWHQGESDANQKDSTRTLAGKLYREYLEKIIQDSRREIGWNVPWFVAQVSYHVPGDEASQDIRDAQVSLVKDRIALEGPDSDALRGEFRERGGQGVHFSGEGLQVHAAKWAEKIIPWIERQ